MGLGSFLEDAMDEIRERFVPHEITEEQAQLIADLRKAFIKTAEAITLAVPKGREQSLALTKLEEAQFWADAGVARP